MIAKSNIRKKEHKKLKKYQGLKDRLEQMWKMKSKVIPVVIAALGTVTPKLEERVAPAHSRNNN